MKRHRVDFGPTDPKRSNVLRNLTVSKRPNGCIIAAASDPQPIDFIDQAILSKRHVDHRDIVLILPPGGLIDADDLATVFQNLTLDRQPGVL